MYGLTGALIMALVCCVLFYFFYKFQLSREVQNKVTEHIEVEAQSPRSQNTTMTFVPGDGDNCDSTTVIVEAKTVLFENLMG